MSVVACAGRSATTPAAVPSTRAAARTPLDDARQLVVVTTPDWNATNGTMRRYTRVTAGDAWRAVDDAATPVVVGRTGLAWGTGFDADASDSAPHKHEGDGRSPAGAFPLDTVFGFAPTSDASWVHLPYVQLSPTSDCVDDTASVHYNTVVDRAMTSVVDWNSAEHMRSIRQYEMGVIVGYNATPPRRGRGSCIFLHIWNGPASTTAGCTAFDAGVLRRVIAWLDPRQRPMLVQLPAAAYARLRETWSLPEFK
jgi:D-alanyl-D-alanine dipeptidase